MNYLTVAIAIFILLFVLIQAMKPSFLYNSDGSLRPFGIGYRKKTVVPLPAVAASAAWLVSTSATFVAECEATWVAERVCVVPGVQSPLLLSIEATSGAAVADSRLVILPIGLGVPVSRH